MKRIYSKAVSRILICSSVLSLASVQIPQALAVSGDVIIELNQSSYNTGDRGEAKIIVKSNDGTNFLLQTKLNLSNGLSLNSASGNNISYNNGMIVGTAPQSEFEINVSFSVVNNGEQSVSLSQIKLGATDGSANQTIDSTTQTVNVISSQTESVPTDTVHDNTQQVIEPENTLPTENTQEEVIVEPVERYEPWTAVVVDAGALNVREGPGFNYIILSQLQDGAKVTVTEEQEASGNIWCHIETGWCSKRYLAPGTNIIPELNNSGNNLGTSDDDIERAQQEAIRQQAIQQEAVNQANNNAAQQIDNNKKNAYDYEERQSFPQVNPTYPIPTEETVPMETQSITIETVPTIQQSNQVPQSSEQVGSTSTKKWSLGTLLPYDSSSRYIGYKADEMNAPFYLDLEAYNLSFPENYQKTVLSVCGLNFTAAIPEDKAKRESNVFLVYGSFDKNKEPQLFWFDKTNNNFFSYDKLHEDVVSKQPIITTTKKKITPSIVILGITSFAAAYIIGSVVASSRLLFAFKHGNFKKKKDKTNPYQPNALVPPPPSPIRKPDEVYTMSDDEFEQLLKEYGADSQTMQKSGQFTVEGTSPVRTVDWLSGTTIISPSESPLPDNHKAENNTSNTLSEVDNSQYVSNNNEINNSAPNDHQDVQKKHTKSRHKKSKKKSSNESVSSVPMPTQLENVNKGESVVPKTSTAERRKTSKPYSDFFRKPGSKKTSEIEEEIGEALDKAIKASEIRNTGRLPINEVLAATEVPEINLEIPKIEQDEPEIVLDIKFPKTNLTEYPVIPDIPLKEFEEQHIPTLLESIFENSRTTTSFNDEEFDELMKEAALC